MTMKVLSKVAGLCVAALAAVMSCAQTAPERGMPAAGVPAANVAMEARLRAIYRATDWKVDPTKQAERVQYFQMLLRSGKLTAEQQRIVYPQLSNELMRAGDPEGALAALAAFGKLPGLTPGEVHELHSTRALAYLRLGELENCLEMHGQRACVFPLRASAVHGKPRGAEGAIGELTWLLERDPNDALSRWLLNVASMQLGRWPGGVPAKYLLPGKLFASEGDVGEFLDYASMAGVDLSAHAGGVLLEDFDGDGLLDIVTSSSGPLDPMHLFHNNGDGTFSDWSQRSGLASELGGLNLVLTDYDNDGRPDILVLRGGWWGKYGNYPVSLLHNLGDGRFEDVTERAGLLRQGAIGPTQTAAWADYDNDGRLDLFIGYEPVSEPATAGGAHVDASTAPSHPSLLFHNNGDGTFTEVGQGAGLASQGFVKGVAWGDFNNDGRPDLYVSTHDGQNRLYRNDGPTDPAHPDPAHWRFTDVTAQAGLGGMGSGGAGSGATGSSGPGPTFATWFFDYNNDGWPDIFVAGYYADSMQDVGRFEAGEPFKAGVPHLYRNNRDGTFTDVAKALHLDRAILTMGANFGDLDNDGWLDVYLGNGEPSFQSLLPNRMFRNAGGKAFEDVTTSGGFGHLQKGHAVAFADVEQRGQEDVFEEMGGAFPGDPYRAALYRNPGHPNHSVTLRLEGVRSNRAAYGARVEVMVHDGGQVRHIFRTVGAVSSFGGNPMEQHIGVGQAGLVDEVRVRWPAASGREQVWRGLAVDRGYRLREGSAAAEPVTRRAFALGQHALHPDALQGSMAGMR